MESRETRQSGTMVCGAFPDRESTERAIDYLLNAGYDRDSISVVTRGEQPRMPSSKDSKEGTGAAIGGGIGAALGGAAGLLAGLGLFAIPGIGPILALGPLAMAFTGAVAGGAIGGVAGFYVGAGVPEEEARYYEQYAREGGYVVSLVCGEECESVANRLREAGAIRTTPACDMMTGGAGRTPDQPTA